MYSESDSKEPSTAGEFIIEVIGADGLKHHVGPFRQREDAENWLAQNAPEYDSGAPQGDQTGASNTGNRGRRLSD